MLIKFTNEQLTFLKSQQTPREADQLRYREEQELIEVQRGNENWDALYNSQPDLD
jgi:hypothetical protein